MNLAESLNLGCACQTLQPERLREQLETHPALKGLVAQLAQSHPHLFSSTAVFVDASTGQQLAKTVRALERVIARPQWQTRAIAQAPSIARLDWGPSGVFMGYDFHLSAQGPRLIEINSNAGGAILNAALARAHRACCEAFDEIFKAPETPKAQDDTFVSMFEAEWRSQRAERSLRNIVIVDDSPAQQYLAPEFEMVRGLLAAHGLLAVIADPGELQWRDGSLWHPALPRDMPVDMVYSRLTDFYLQADEHAALRIAYEAGAVVVTPHPRTHALYADKRNLITLSDAPLLASWGIDTDSLAVLAQSVPTTRLVTTENAETLWAQRRSLFFKPSAGFGSRAAYRGDKLTRRVWGDILSGSYVAQTMVPPSERLVWVDGETKRLKVDLRAYTYRGEVQLLAARTWSGQTTNFRTEGGGFSPVVVLPALPFPEVDTSATSLQYRPD
ncbi:hypothetical protein [Hydrogenophaga sp.]|uniref:hypothetical protein n=1 Tax=Hydrogenophaga sp. TaxID=1904254 RepID=UPI00271B08E8|nr:hypothetical protein [Hydrogenophaga sp.]MDO8906047.1 hypothetical protein [Hydrogenophaga sp.]